MVFPLIRTYPHAAEVPPDVVAWAEAQALAHEEEWGFDEDVTIQYPLCGWRGSVGRHRDTDIHAGDEIVGLILKGEQWLEADGAVPLMLKPGTLYRLVPSVMHGTTAHSEDDLLLFLTDSISPDDHRTPVQIASDLIAKADRTRMRFPTFTNFAR